ncbi:MAG: LysR family transcriptional regulator [Bdellovibrionaceae bacterium]|nr:LysR family transcriptional regulator [Pseudobdellovibrionaceae bacterium]
MHVFRYIRQMDWDGFRYFLALYREGSLKLAAKELKVDQTTVGRRIAALEESLGTRLFEKRSDGYILTLAAERILPTLQAMENSAFSVDRAITGQDERPTGLVRIAMPRALANHWLIPRLSNLMIENPEIEIEFLTGAEVVNLAKRQADIALRLVRPSQRDLIVRKTGEMTLGLFMHPKLLQGRKKPQHLEQLKSFPFVGLVARATSDFEFKLLQKLEPHIRYSLRSAAWSSVFYSIQAGLGWGILPTFFEDRDPELIQINVVEPITTPLWLVAHPDIIKSARVRVVVDYILKS